MDDAHELRLIDEYCGDAALLQQAMGEYQRMLREMAIRGDGVGRGNVAEVVRELSEL